MTASAPFLFRYHFPYQCDHCSISDEDVNTSDLAQDVLQGESRDELMPLLHVNSELQALRRLATPPPREAISGASHSLYPRSF